MAEKERIVRLLFEEGFDAVGVTGPRVPEAASKLAQWLELGFEAEMGYMRRTAGQRHDATSLLPDCRSVIAVALSYRRSVTYVPGQPRISSYALGRDYHRLMRKKLARVVAAVSRDLPGESWRIAVDSAPLLDRAFAHAAGLGWFGKNTCLIDTDRGSEFFIGLILTSLELPTDEPARGSCGTCRLCVDACPTGCIRFVDGQWFVDSRDCISYLTIEHRGDFDSRQSRQIGEWTFGCDVCQKVCPFNRPSRHNPLRGAEAGCPELAPDRTWPSLAHLAEIGPEEWDRLTRGSPVRRAGWEGLRRNARANLHNARSGERGDP